MKDSDGLGRVVAATRGAEVTATRHDGNGNPVFVTDPNGHATAAVFDGANRRILETRGAGTAAASTTTFKYDVVGNRTETKSARVTEVAYDVRETYDDLNRPVRSKDALDNVTTRAFDEAGNNLCEKRPLGNAGGAAFGHGPGRRAHCGSARRGGVHGGLPHPLRVRRAGEARTGDDCKPVGEGISEMRIDYGPCYRLYFLQRGPEVVILLVGGGKATQAKDIELPKRLAKQV